MKKKTSRDVSEDFDRPPPQQMVRIDVDELSYWSSRLYCDRKDAPKDLESFAKKKTTALVEAARFFELDLYSPMDRAILLRVLADILFRPRRKRGRPPNSKKWTATRLSQLACDCEEVKRGRPKLSSARAAGAIKNRYPKRYEHTSSEMIRQRLPQARTRHADILVKKLLGVDSGVLDDEIPD